MRIFLKRIQLVLRDSLGRMGLVGRFNASEEKNMNDKNDGNVAILVIIAIFVPLIVVFVFRGCFSSPLG